MDGKENISIEPYLKRATLINIDMRLSLFYYSKRWMYLLPPKGSKSLTVLSDNENQTAVLCEAYLLFIPSCITSRNGFEKICTALESETKGLFFALRKMSRHRPVLYSLFKPETTCILKSYFGRLERN